MHRTPALTNGLALTFIFGGFGMMSSLPAADDDDDDDRGVYELRVYTCEEGRLPALHQRFSDHTMKLFEKHGMQNVAYFTPTDEPESETTLIYLLWHESREAAAQSWDAFRNDDEWKQVLAESEKDGKILARSPESTFLVATDYSPEVEPVTDEFVYELRIYTAAEGKLAALHDRFRDHTLDLFEKHGMSNVGYFNPEDEPESNTQLVYIIAHKNRDAAAASWKAFIEDPDWKRAAAASRVDGRLVAEIESTYMQPTDYTPE